MARNFAIIRFFLFHLQVEPMLPLEITLAEYLTLWKHITPFGVCVSAYEACGDTHPCDKNRQDPLQDAGYEGISHILQAQTHGPLVIFSHGGSTSNSWVPQSPLPPGTC